MEAPNRNRQKKAYRILDDIFKDPKNVWVIHYSCESFYDRPEGRSPRVTSIALCNLDSLQSESFSIHKIAERSDIPFKEIKNHYDDLEVNMIGDFFQHISRHRGMKYLHWNMRDGNYGFQAITHRFRVLHGNEEQLYEVEETRKVDLARILKDIYGDSYVGDPRLQKLLEKNEMTPRDFLTGDKEASAFEQQNYNDLHLSTLSKVHAMAKIASLAHERNLKTNTSWWAMHLGQVRTSWTWILEHRILVGGGSLASIIALIWFVVEAIR